MQIFPAVLYIQSWRACLSKPWRLSSGEKDWRAVLVWSRTNPSSSGSSSNWRPRLSLLRLSVASSNTSRTLSRTLSSFFNLVVKVFLMSVAHLNHIYHLVLFADVFLPWINITNMTQVNRRMAVMAVIVVKQWSYLDWVGRGDNCKK